MLLKNIVSSKFNDSGMPMFLWNAYISDAWSCMNSWHFYYIMYVLGFGKDISTCKSENTLQASGFSYAKHYAAIFLSHLWCSVWHGRDQLLIGLSRGKHYLSWPVGNMFSLPAAVKWLTCNPKHAAWPNLPSLGNKSR